MQIIVTILSRNVNENNKKKMLLNPIKFQRAVWLHLSVLPRALVKCFVFL